MKNALASLCVLLATTAAHAITFEQIGPKDPDMARVGVISEFFREYGPYTLKFKCTATLIGDRWVLTSAACATDQYIGPDGLETYQLVFQEKAGEQDYHLLKRVIFPSCYRERKSYRSSNASVDLPSNPECDYALLELVDPIEGLAAQPLAAYSANAEALCSIGHMTMKDYAGTWKSCGSRNTNSETVVLNPEYQSPVLAPFVMRSGPGFGGAPVTDSSGELVGMVIGGSLFGNLVRPDPMTTVLAFNQEILGKLQSWMDGTLTEDTEVFHFGWELGAQKVARPFTQLLYQNEEERVSDPILLRRTARTGNALTATFNVSPIEAGRVFQKKYLFDFSRLPALQGDQEELYEVTFLVTHSKYWFFGQREKLTIRAIVRVISAYGNYDYTANAKGFVIQ